MAEERRELQEAGYATLGQAVVGHVMISVVIAPLVVGVLWLLGLIMQPGAGVGAIVVLGLVTTVASEVLMALGERPAVVRARHSAPGGWAYAMWVFVVPPLVGFAVGWWESPRVAVPTALAALIVFWAVGLWSQPWKRGDSQAEVRAKWEAAKEMTAETFREDKLSDGWVIRRDGQGDDDFLEDIPLWASVLSRLLSSLVGVPFLVGALYLLSWLLHLDLGFGTAILIGFATATTSSVLVALAEHPAVVRARNPRPGGWAYAVWIFVFPPIVGVGIGGWQAPELALPSGLAALVVFWTAACAVKPWRRALRKADYQANWEATRKWLQETEENS